MEALALRSTDPVAAFGSLIDLAREGSPIAMNEVGECYYWGRLGVAPDELRAEVWLKKAFEAGSLRSLLTYGKLLAWRGDMVGAEAVFASAAGEDWAPALYWLASTRLKRSSSPETLAGARSLLERAAAQGHPAARWRLGKDMCRGLYGLHNIPRGFGVLAKYAAETLAAWESRGAAIPRATSSGETIH